MRLHGALHGVLASMAGQEVERAIAGVGANFTGMSAPSTSETFTRASVDNVFDADGILRALSVDEAAFPHDSIDGIWRPAGLRVQGSQTNALLHSRDGTNGAWNDTTATVTRDQVGIDGVANTASKVSDDNTTSVRRLSQDVAISDDLNPVAISILLRRTGGVHRYTGFELRLFGGPSDLRHRIVVDVVAASFVTQDGFTAGSAELRVLSDDWLRLDITVTNDQSGNDTGNLRLFPVFNNNGSQTPDADAQGYAVVDFPMLATGSDHAGWSYVETQGTPVTRVADLADVDVSPLDLTAFSFAVAWDIEGLEADSARVLEFNDGTASNQINISRSGDNVALNVVTASSFEASLVLGPWTAGRHKAVVRIAADDVAGCLDGGAVVKDTSVVVPPVDALLLGRSIGASWLNSTLGGYAVWPTVLSDGALQAQSLRS